MHSFSPFSDHDFELLIAQLLSEEYGLHFEAFARGADRGIDLRHTARGDPHPDIVQCKHYVSSSFSKLKTAARHEAVLLPLLDPTPRSYRFVTSQPLTVPRKEALIEILRPWITGPEDIFGAHDLEVLINRHPRIERQNAKLWLTGGGQLDALIHSGIYARSQRLLEETRSALDRYVESDAFFAARERLRSERALIITGPPGIGKTTLARMLLADAALDKYEPIEISADINEANEVLRRGERQVFHYDDFLGTTFLRDHLKKNEEKRIAQFVRRAVSSPELLLVLTTREYIMNQALELYDDFEQAGLDARRFVLSLDGYSLLDRARIFYNHIWASGQLKPTARASLLLDRAYYRVVSHRNYNPRLIEHITGLGAHRLSDAENADYVDFALRVLDQPELLWERAFEHQLDDVQRAIVIASASMPGTMTIDALQSAASGYCAEAGIELRDRWFIRALRVLADSFVRLTADGGISLVAPANPSVLDFVARWLAASSSAGIAALNGVAFFEQLNWLNEYLVEGAADLSLRTERGVVLCKCIRRCFDSDNPAWTRTWRYGTGEMSWQPEVPDVTARLVWVARLIARHPEYQALLEPWLEQRLRDEADAWKRGEVFQTEQPVALVVALGGDRAPDYLIEAAKDFVSGETGEQSAGRWEQGPGLRAVVVDSFVDDEWQDLGRRFIDWAEGQLDRAGLDIEDVRQLTYLAEEYGVALDQDLVQRAEEDAEERSREADASDWNSDDDWHDRDSREHGQDVNDQIDLLFAHLAE